MKSIWKQIGKSRLHLKQQVMSNVLPGQWNGHQATFQRQHFFIRTHGCGCRGCISVFCCHRCNRCCSAKNGAYPKSSPWCNRWKGAWVLLALIWYSTSWFSISHNLCIHHWLHKNIWLIKYLLQKTSQQTKNKKCGDPNGLLLEGEALQPEPF